MLHRAFPVRRFVDLRPIGVGAAPPLVAAGGPGARDEVRAYAARIDKAVKSFQHDINLQTSGLAEKGKVLTDDQTEWLLFTWPDWHTKWKSYYASLQEFDLFGDSPSNAWQKLELREEELKKHRAKFASFKLGTLTPVPGDLADEDAYNPEKRPFISTKTALIGLGLISATGYLLSQVRGLSGR